MATEEDMMRMMRLNSQYSSDNNIQRQFPESTPESNETYFDRFYNKDNVPHSDPEARKANYSRRKLD